MARELGLEWRHQPATEIVRHCVDKIAGWLSDFEFGSFDTVPKLQRLVCAKLKLVIEEAHSAADIAALERKYATELGEGAFAHLGKELGEKTFGVLMRRQHAGPADRNHFVAVIDCRGPKLARRYFSRWHEIAHMLTLSDQLALPFHRSEDDGSPLERLMDMIAGEVGFYGPLFNPALETALQSAGRLTFHVVEELQASFAPDASFQSTLIACIKRSRLAAAYVEVGLGYKKGERAVLRSGQLFLDGTAPEPKLRVLKCSSNPAAKSAKIMFHGNMEVPRCSAVFGRFYGVVVEERVERESLRLWTHSDGSCLGCMDVQLETRRIKDHLIALVTPA
jgi:hypothetical protein